MTKKKIRNNPNGNLDIIELIAMIHTGDIDKYMRKFNLIVDKCPPYDLIPSNTQCTYCVTCQRACIDQVKEYKTYYKIGKLKFEKSELDKKE